MRNARNTLLKVCSFLLSILMLTGVISLAGFGTARAEDDASKSAELLSNEKPTVNSAIPHTFWDFTTHFNFEGTVNMSVSVTEGSHTTFTATADDPVANTYLPDFKPSECKSVAIIYRTDMDKDGELYCNRSDGVVMGQQGGVQIWRWIPTKEFAKMSVVCEAWKDVSADVSFTDFRFDPLNPLIKSGDSIDIRCIAFFDTEDGAEGFNYDEYMKLYTWEKENQSGDNNDEEIETGAAVDWADPAYQEMETIPDDTKEGSLTVTESQNGTTLTISYKVNGEIKTLTVPNNEINRFGGFAATDDLGRSLYDATQVGVIESEGKKNVGLFYFLWHGRHGSTDTIYNLQEILDSTPREDWGKLSTGKYGQFGEFHWFAEPLYGYYYMNDEWVIRKHMELLTNAGVDFLFFDTTNNFTYADTALQVMKVLHEMNEQGYDAPQVVFYTNTDAKVRIRAIYDEIYAQNLYPDTWFCINGKPVMIGPNNANVENFFTMKINQWPTEKKDHLNAWPWMDGKRPQYIYKDLTLKDSAINVSVAQHRSTWRFSDSIYDAMDRGNLGRSYGYAEITDELTNKYYDDIEADPELYKQGLNFQAQWDVAHEAGVPYVLVTGWNEWIAQIQSTSDEYAHFVDLASVEFSRDLEMMKGGYFDNYYVQLAYNIQKYKGAAPIIPQDARNPINVTGDFDQWDAVTVTYTDPIRDCLDRNGNGYGMQVYTDTTGRNDLTGFKITHDTKNVYFLAETRFDISKPEKDSSWMQLFIDADRDAKTGWYGYDFIINYEAKDEFTTTVAKCNGKDGAYAFEVIGEVSYRAKGNQMMIAVPLTLLGVENYNDLAFDFKWVDSDSKVTTMEQFYTEGDAAPLGRLNYVFTNHHPEESITSPDGETATEPPASSVTEDNGSGNEKGCKSTLSVSLLPLSALISAAVALVCKKRKDD